jgi:mxaC protein
MMGLSPDSFGLDHPQALLLAPLAVLPFVASVLERRGHPSLAAAPADLASRVLSVTVRTLGAAAIAAAIIGLGGLHRLGESVERLGQGAHIVLLIDRSASMNDSFAGRRPSGAEEAKAAAARRLLLSFIAGRPHDRIGVAAFSTSPMLALPLTDRQEAVRAAVSAIDRPGLAYTDVGRGLAMALGMLDDPSEAASRAVLLVSDGAAVIGKKAEAALRDAFARRRVHLYWLFLRTSGGQGIFSAPAMAGQDTPQAMPERHLHKFFESLRTPYRAFEAETPEAVEQAIAEIGRLESGPLRYVERVPREDLSGLAYAVAAAAVALLAAVVLTEAQR